MDSASVATSTVSLSKQQEGSAPEIEEVPSTVETEVTCNVSGETTDTRTRAYLAQSPYKKYRLSQPHSKAPMQSPSTVIGETIGRVGGKLFSCLHGGRHYVPSGSEENDLMFDVHQQNPVAKRALHNPPTLHMEEEEEKKEDHRRLQFKRTPNSILSNQDYPTCDGCLKRIYPTDSVTKAFSPTRTFHSNCFKCYLCSSQLRYHGEEVCIRIPDEESEEGSLFRHILLCQPCQQASQSEYSEKRLSTIAGTRVAPTENEFGDVDGVLDEIGEELEHVMMHNYVPTCTICGGNFLSYESNRVVIMGPTLKFHYECWETGKPSVDIQQRKLEPIQAVRYLPNELILRIRSEESITTLYFEWKNRLEDFKSLVAESKSTNSLRVLYSINENTNTGSSIKRPWVPLKYLYTFELVGEPLGKCMLADSTSTISRKTNEDVEAIGCMRVSRFELHHAVRIRIPIVKEYHGRGHGQDHLDLQKSTLTIDLIDE
eukprot:CAMPEP_0113650482 /NCGR_PEP_ID=MMETSP0017_2-20120614/26866_1 /TAXON_ID=2856 /ORGANISM="Cylindrotheca closterium" /LENGTH=485 /DNA_ID=CAMNT_0000563005 /DNA_START=762 /DNA_END=2219 /DNA_ORIENTATION=+ /assembly_acc=CAM_ASM_000147